VETTRARPVVDLGAGAHLPTSVSQPLHGCRAGCFEQVGFRAGIGESRRRDLGGLDLGELPGTERHIGVVQLLERLCSLQGSRRGTNCRPRGLCDPVRGAPMTALAPHPGLVNASRHQRFHGRAHALAFADDFEERSSILAVDAQRVEIARRRLQSVDCVANSLEHDILRMTQPPGKSREVLRSIRTYVRSVKRERMAG
jgi:hypothetical protein